MSMPKLNDYELLEIIGSGSYSVVHRAKHKVSIFQYLNSNCHHWTYVTHHVPKIKKKTNCFCYRKRNYLLP